MSLNKFDLLKKYYGYHTFREGQEALIDHLLEGKDVLGVMPTGAGKSICYQIPALLLPGITLVVSPLISLMQDQVSALVQNGISAAYINSSLTSVQYQKVLSRIKENAYKLIYVAPERLLHEGFIEIAKQLNISLIAVDEAHCVSHWGQDFRPSYTKIAEFTQLLKQRPIVSAFTATATKEVKEDIIQQLQLQDPFRITTGFDRKNLYFEVRHPKNKNDELLKILLELKGQNGIIYCNTRKHVEAVYDVLQSKGYRVAMYHAGLSDSQRLIAQQDFLFDRKELMVATNAFGMGIDKSNVSFVIHYNMPKDMESYYQEAGRAGRDGSNASCILLYSGMDVRTNQFLINLSNQNKDMDEHMKVMLQQRDLQRLKTMTFYCHSKECLRHSILHYFEEASGSYCGNCYNCQHLVEEIDITTEAQKIISCIKRMGECFGAGMVCDVLRGRRHERLMKAGLQTLSTYGIMQEVPAQRIREIIQYLQSLGYLQVQGDQYQILYVQQKAKELLTSDAHLTMKVFKKEQAAPMKQVDNSTSSPALLSALRALRATLAKEQHVPAYIIFNDATLLEMSKIAPRSEEEFLMVSGVGANKLKRYGKDFLAVIKTFE